MESKFEAARFRPQVFNFSYRRGSMIRNNRLQMIAVLAIGGLVGYAAVPASSAYSCRVDAGPSPVRGIEKVAAASPSTTAFRGERAPLRARPLRWPL